MRMAPLCRPFHVACPPPSAGALPLKALVRPRYRCWRQAGSSGSSRIHCCPRQTSTWPMRSRSRAGPFVRLQRSNVWAVQNHHTPNKGCSGGVQWPSRYSAMEAVHQARLFPRAPLVAVGSRAIIRIRRLPCQCQFTRRRVHVDNLQACLLGQEVRESSQKGPRRQAQ